MMLDTWSVTGCTVKEKEKSQNNCHSKELSKMEKKSFISKKFLVNQSTTNFKNKKWKKSVKFWNLMSTIIVMQQNHNLKGQNKKKISKQLGRSSVF